MQKIYCVSSGGGGRLCFVGIHLYGEGKLLKNSRNILRSWKKKVIPVIVGILVQVT